MEIKIYMILALMGAIFAFSYLANRRKEPAPER